MSPEEIAPPAEAPVIAAPPRAVRLVAKQPVTEEERRVLEKGREKMQGK